MREEICACCQRATNNFGARNVVLTRRRIKLTLRGGVTTVREDANCGRGATPHKGLGGSQMAPTRFGSRPSVLDL